MSDGGDNTQVGDVTLFDTGYFDQDYKLQAIWLGLLWFFIGTIPTTGYEVWYSTQSVTGWLMSPGTAHAWGVLRWALGDSFWLLGVFWLLAYIKHGDQRIFQKVYYRAIAWIIPLSWVFALWALLAFIIGGTQEPWGDIGTNLGFGFGFMVVLGGLEALAWFLGPRVVKFYKWDQQSWWNYDGPDTWPDQLGDFVNEM